MKKFLVAIDLRSERPDCFTIEGKSIDDPEMREQMALYVTQMRDESFSDDLFNITEEEAEEDSYRISIFEISKEYTDSSKKVFLEAWKLTKKQAEEYDEYKRKEKEKQEKIDYEKLKKKFGDK